MAPVAGFFAGALGWAAAGSTMAGVSAGIAFGQSIIGGLIVNLVTSVAIGALQTALAADPQGGGISINSTLRGEDSPETIILGKYATGGQCVYLNSHGKSNKYLTHVVEICSAPGATLRRLMLDDEWCAIGTTADPDYGYPITYEDRTGYAWIKYYDGRQTVADPMLRAKYGADPDMPWEATAVGQGLCYAILTFKQHREHMPQVPPYRFEIQGIPLYDIRKDSTAGGSGSQRLGNPATWAQTDNPVVMAWNIKRGIPLPGGQIWGGGFGPDRLPRATWVAAMNACDAAVATSGGGTRAAYRAGIEAALTQEPAATLTELYKAASATVADMGYAWQIVVGAPSLPVFSFTDRDVIVSKSQTLTPFPSISDTYNAVSARYPDPAHKWETKEAPLRTNAGWEALDAFGRRTAAITLPAVPYPAQVQQLQRAWINEERRFRRHIINLPPEAAVVELGDIITWTSLRNGYEAKAFSVHEVAEDLRTGIRQVSLKERDASDYDWTGADELPMPVGPTITPRPAEIVPGFAVSGINIQDASGRNRRPAIALSWDDDIEAKGIKWQIRLAGSSTVSLRGDTQELDEGGQIVKSGILPATSYQVRARLISKKTTDWTTWKSVTTPATYIRDIDVADEFIDQIQQIADLAGVPTVTALPMSGNRTGRIVVLLPAGRLYRWTGSTWTEQLVPGLEPGSLDIAAFAASIRPIEIVTALPTTGNFDGRMAYVTGTKRLHRHNGTAWIDTNAADQIVGKLTAGQIAAGAIGADQLAAKSVTIAALVITNFTNLILNSELASADGWSFFNGASFVAAPPGNASAPGNVATPPITTGESLARYFMGAGNRLPVKPGEEYFLAADFRASGTTPSFRTRIVVWMYDRAGTYLGAAVGGIAILTNATYTQQSLTWTVPAGVAYCEVGFGRGGDAGASGTGYIENPSMRRRNDGELIIDGALKARHMAAEEIITNTAQIRALLVNTAHLANASVSTLKIGNQAVSADWNTYSAGWMSMAGNMLDVQSLTINDPTVGGAVAWVTFSAHVALRRTTAGISSGGFGINVSGLGSIGSWDISLYCPAAGVAGEVSVPVSITKRFVMPAGGNVVIEVIAASPDPDQTFRFRYRRIEVNVMKR